MRLWAPIPIAIALLGCDASPARTQGPATADAALRTGEYERAVELYRSATTDPGNVAARRGLLRALAEIGRYAEAEQEGRRFAAGPDSGSAIATALGEVLERQGKGAEAERWYRRAASGGSDSLVGRFHLARLAWDRGEHDSALQAFDRFIDIYNDAGGRLSSEDLAAVGGALRYLGRRDPQLYRDALKALDEAVARDSGNLAAQVQTGELFLEKYNSGDARETFLAVLAINPRHPGALLGLARQLQFDGQSGATDQVAKALVTNPAFVSAMVLQASLHLDAERYPEAKRQLERALAIDSTALPVLAVLATAQHLEGDERGFERTRRRILERNPVYAELYRTMAELSARHRRYSEAVALARQGVALDSTAWETWGLLGINQFRTPEFAQARRSLEIAFRGDPYNVWIKNTLDLLDAQARYRESRTARFHFLIEENEAALLEPYFAAVAEEAWTRMAERYGYRPDETIRLEVYRRHTDFSVRTAGLPGFGALGVSFGPLLAMDSPGARERGQFNWASTTWHEIAHTFTLGVTRNRIPRWLSEGLSVLEERRTGRGWGAQATVDFLLAWKQQRLHPVSKLNEGFVNPSYPAHVIHSYYQASLVCEMIEQQWGWPKMRELLDQYRRDRETGVAFQQALGISLDDFDRRFREYVNQRFAVPLAAINPPSAPPPADPAAAIAQATSNQRDLLAQLAAGRMLLAAGRGDEAVAYLERAKSLFPEYAGPDSPYRLLAEVYRERDPRRAEQELARHAELSETDYDTQVVLSAIRVQLGDTAGAASALDRAIWIHPYDPAVHERLATLEAARGDFSAAARERAAVVALDPVDRPEALYQLALVQFRGRDLAAARRNVLAALDLAPTFEQAQSLLLEIRRASPGGGQ
jgi:cellulose synthase operon protein C